MSHGTMNAFFSGTDNSDDVRGRYSIVIGNNKNIQQEIKARFNYGKKHVDMKIDDLFEENNNFVLQDYNFEEWIKQLKHEVINNSNVFYINGSGSMISVGNNTKPYDGYQGNFYRQNQYSKTSFNQADIEKYNVNLPIRCSNCGKFKKRQEIEYFSDAPLCEDCATYLGVFHVCP